MKHPADQDLLLLAHNSLSPLKAIAAQMHLARCADCKRRYAEFGVVTTAAAAAFRGSLPSWKPLGMALRTKLLLAALVVSAGVLGARVALNREEPPVVGTVKECFSPPKTKGSAPTVDVKGAPKPHR